MTAARIDPLVRSFERFMRAERKSERTIANYFEALEQFAAHLESRGRSLDQASTADVQDYIIDIIERRRPSTPNNRFRALHRFYVWLEDEEEIPNPMRRLKPPPVPEEPISVLDAEALRRLFEVCQGRGFDERRDTAMLSLFLRPVWVVMSIRGRAAYAAIHPRHQQCPWRRSLAVRPQIDEVVGSGQPVQPTGLTQAADMQQDPSAARCATSRACPRLIGMKGWGTERPGRRGVTRRGRG